MSDDLDRGATPQWAICPDCGGEIVAGYPCGNCVKQKDSMIQGPDSPPPRPVSWLERVLPWSAVGTIGLFVLIYIYGNSSETEGPLSYRIGGLIGSLVIGYGVYRLGRFIARRRRDESLTPAVSTPSPTPWYGGGWVRVAALVLILTVGVASAILSAGSSGGSFEDGFLHGMEKSARDQGISEESWDCIEEGLRAGGYVTALEPLTEDRTQAELVAMFTAAGSNPLADAPLEIRQLAEGFARIIADPAEGCLTLEELTALAGLDQPGAPLAYGSDPQLDSLHDGCIGGTFIDCDMLWLASAPDSEYEDVASTCGGRDSTLDPYTDPFCVVLFGDLEEISSVRYQCEQGFFPACDLLYMLSDVGSPDETFGSTCGDRREATEYLLCSMDLGLGSR